MTGEANGRASHWSTNSVRETEHPGAHQQTNGSQPHVEGELEADGSQPGLGHVQPAAVPTLARCHGGGRRRHALLPRSGTRIVFLTSITSTSPSFFWKS